MRLRFLFLFLALTARISAQQVSGIVLDAKKRNPIPDCLVIIKGSAHSALTDSKGKFSIPYSLPKGNINLVITTLGYVTAEFNLSNYKKDTFYLSAKDYQLKEVTIVADRKKILNPGSEEPIMDFDLLNDALVLLTPGKDRNYLKLIADDGKLITQTPVNKNSESLQSDCLEHLQLYSSDSVWQIFFDFEQLRSLHPFSLPAFQTILGKCVCSENSDFYFRDHEYRGLKTNYYYFSENEKGVRKDLICFGDTAKIRSFELDYNLNYFLGIRRSSRYTMYNEPVDSIKKHLQRYREELALDWAYQKWLGKVETEMIKTDSALFIVNFTDTTIYRVTPDHTVRSQCRLEAAHQKDLLFKVYTDRAYKDHYLACYAENKLSLIKFDMTTGKQLSINTIPDLPFLPRKLLIHEGNLYFVQKNLADQQSYKLIRYALKN